MSLPASLRSISELFRLPEKKNMESEIDQFMSFLVHFDICFLALPCLFSQPFESLHLTNYRLQNYDAALQNVAHCSKGFCQAEILCSLRISNKLKKIKLNKFSKSNSIWHTGRLGTHLIVKIHIFGFS